MPPFNLRAGNNPALNAFVPDSELFVLKPWIAILALLADCGLIAMAFACAILWSHPIVYLIAALIIARSQLALAVIMHDSAHGLLTTGQRLNDLLGQLCAAGPLFLSLQTYRAGHLKHHQNPMQSDDPIVAVFGLADFPLPRNKMVIRLLADLCGVGYFISIFRFARGDYRASMPKIDKSARLKIGEVLSMLISNTFLFSLLNWFGHPLLYPGLWLLPAITLLPFMGRIRAIMEHAGLPACDDQSQNARTIVRANWETFFFGPHAIHYHIEHHLYVRIPFYHLRQVHQQLASRQLLPGKNIYKGYIAVLRDVSYPVSETSTPGDNIQ